MFNKKYLSDGVIELRLAKVVRNFWLTPLAYQYGIYKCDEQVAVGHCDYRCRENEENYFAGNIGYMIYQFHRGHHYAYLAAKLLCDLAVSLKAKKLYITCSPENVASFKTIEKLGAEFIEETAVPKNHYLYSQGEKIKKIFVMKFEN